MTAHACALFACLATATAAAADPVEPPLGARGVLAAGWDSNPLLLEGPNQRVTDLQGVQYGAAATVAWRALRGAERSLTLAPTAGVDWYPDQELARQVRVGAIAAGSVRAGAWLPALSLGAHRYWLDGEAAADVLTASLSCNRPAATWVALPALEATRYDYEALDDADGTLVALHYRHWLLPNPGDARRRYELSARVGSYLAEADYESYAIARVEAGVHWPLGEVRQAGGWDLAAATWYEWRAYDERVPGAEAEETSHLVGLEMAADRWFGPWLAAGAYVRGTLRESSYEWRDYDRLQGGVRLTAAY